MPIPARRRRSSATSSIFRRRHSLTSYRLSRAPRTRGGSPRWVGRRPVSRNRTFRPVCHRFGSAGTGTARPSISWPSAISLLTSIFRRTSRLLVSRCSCYRWLYQCKSRQAKSSRHGRSASRLTSNQCSTTIFEFYTRDSCHAYSILSLG